MVTIQNIKHNLQHQIQLTMRQTLRSIILIILLGNQAFAQGTVTGVIKDDQGTPVVHATVLLKGTNVYAVADSNGQFNIAAGKELPFSLLINFVGYKTQEVRVSELTD